MKIVAFLCTWCSYAGADLAGTGRNQYPPNIRVIRIPCSGRINPLYIIKALLEGADGVMVSGCHPGDCHYLVGNYYARRRFVVLKRLLTAAGFEPDRVHFTWISASEGVRFADVVREVTEKVTTVLPTATTLPVEDRVDNGVSQVGESSAAAPFGEPVIDYNKRQEELVLLCRKLLTDGTVDSVIGFKAGGENGLSLPYFLDSPDDADKLVLNSRCVPNLSGYLRDSNGKTAIVAKPCDARAVVSLIVENQLKRDDVYIIGFDCDGMVNEEGRSLPCCVDCRVRKPPVYDAFVGDIGEAGASDLSHGKLRAVDESSKRFADEMSKCILCFGCRQSCYGCYCNTCFIDRGEPDWQTASPDIGSKMLYHLGRAMHLSGRCVGCGACENACASGVDIRYLISAVTEFIDDTYDFRSGMDLEAEPVLLTYKSDDPEIGFLGKVDE